MPNEPFRKKRYRDCNGLIEYLGNSRSPGAIRNLVMRRKIPFKKVAGRLLFDLDEVDEWIRMSEGVSLEEIMK